MVQLRISHTVRDFDEWKRMFDSDPVDRRGGGVRRYVIARSAASPDHVLIDLHFDSRAEAEAMQARLRGLWAGPAARMLQDADAAVVDVVESVDL